MNKVGRNGAGGCNSAEEEVIVLNGNKPQGENNNCGENPQEGNRLDFFSNYIYLWGNIWEGQKKSNNLNLFQTSRDSQSFPFTPKVSSFKTDKKRISIHLF